MDSKHECVCNSLAVFLDVVGHSVEFSTSVVESEQGRSVVPTLCKTIPPASQQLFKFVMDYM